MQGNRHIGGIESTYPNLDMSTYRNARPRGIATKPGDGKKQVESPTKGTPSPGGRTRRRSTLSPSKAKHHFELKKFVDMEASTGASEFLTRMRDILIKPTSIRSYDDVIELKKQLKSMDFVHSIAVPHATLAKDGLTAMRFNDHDGPVWRSLDAMCMYFELKKYKQGSTIFNRGDPGKKYCVVLGGSVEVVEEAAESNENEHVNEIDDMIDQMEDDRDLVDKVMESFPKEVQDSLNALSHKVAESGTFDDLDSDGNGVLTADELFPVLAGFTRSEFAVTMEQCKRFAEILDDDGNGEISRDEFSTFVKTMMVMAHIGASRTKEKPDSIFRMNTPAHSLEPDSPMTPQSPLKRSASSLSLRRTSSAMFTESGEQTDELLEEDEEEEEEENKETEESELVIEGLEAIVSEGGSTEDATSSKMSEMSGPLFRLFSKYRRDKNAKRKTNRQRKDILAFGMLFGEMDENGKYNTTVKATQNCEIIEVDIELVEKLLHIDWKAIKDTATDDIPESVLVDGKAGNPPDPKPFTEWVMRLHPSRRKHEHVCLVSEYLLQKSDFLKQLNSDERVHICKLLEFAEIAPKHVVYKQGTEGKALYIVFQGMVELQVKTPESVAKDEFGFARLDHFTEGESFGDAVLVPGPSKRRETVITRDENVNSFLVLPKDKYLNRLVGDRGEEIALRIKTLKRNPALQGMPGELLTELAQYMEPQKFSAGENPIIAVQGEEGSGIYFIARGQCSTTRHVVASMSSISIGSPVSGSRTSESILNSPRSPEMQSNTSLRKGQVTVDLGELGPGAVIGAHVFEGMIDNEREHLEEPLIWQDTIRAKAACLLYQVAKEDLCIHISAACRAELSKRLHNGKVFHHELWNAIPGELSDSQLDFSRSWTHTKAETCSKYLDMTKLDTARISDYVTVFGHRLYSQPKAYEIGPGAATYESFATTKTLSKQSMSLNALRALKMEKTAKSKALAAPTTWLRGYVKETGWEMGFDDGDPAATAPPQTPNELASSASAANSSSKSEELLRLVRTAPIGQSLKYSQKKTGSDTALGSKAGAWSRGEAPPKYVRDMLPGKLGVYERPSGNPEDRFARPKSPPLEDLEDAAIFRDRRSNVSSPVRFMGAPPQRDMLLSMKHIKPRTGFALTQYVRRTTDAGGFLRTAEVFSRLCGVYKTMEEAQSLINAVFAHNNILSGAGVQENVQFVDFDAWEMLDLSKECHFLLSMDDQVKYCLSCDWDLETNDVDGEGAFPALCKSLDQRYAAVTLVAPIPDGIDQSTVMPSQTFDTIRTGETFGPTFITDMRFVKKVHGCFNR